MAPTNLVNAHGALVDHATKRDMLQRALRTKEAHYGQDHHEVAITLTNLAHALGALLDLAAKTFWLDKVCIDQLSIADGLHVLPVSVVACKLVLVIWDVTFPIRLWCWSLLQT